MRTSGPNLAKPRASERGASAVEYALLIAGIAAVLVIVIISFGAEVRGLFDSTCVAVEESAAESAC